MLFKLLTFLCLTVWHSPSLPSKPPHRHLLPDLLLVPPSIFITVLCFLNYMFILLHTQYGCHPLYFLFHTHLNSERLGCGLRHLIFCSMGSCFWLVTPRVLCCVHRCGKMLIGSALLMVRVSMRVSVMVSAVVWTAFVYA